MRSNISYTFSPKCNFTFFQKLNVIFDIFLFAIGNVPGYGPSFLSNHIQVLGYQAHFWHSCNTNRLLQLLKRSHPSIHLQIVWKVCPKRKGHTHKKKALLSFVQKYRSKGAREERRNDIRRTFLNFSLFFHYIVKRHFHYWTSFLREREGKKFYPLLSPQLLAVTSILTPTQVQIDFITIILSKKYTFSFSTIFPLLF